MPATGTKQVGQVIAGKFRLGEFIGGNENSSVFLTDYDAQEVPQAAIKMIAVDSAEAVGQLDRWGQAAKLSHPHLIRLLDMGLCELDDGPVVYVVMEYAEENLSSVIARRPLTPEEARGILGPLLDVLAHIHASGFVHARLKAANIMADNDILKISSDGLRSIGESSAGQGKPGVYDPPEAADGMISPAADVWSLGMTLVEVLTQCLPAWKTNDQLEPVLPSTLPEEFRDVARHCLRRDPKLRWTVADIAERLQQKQIPPAKPAPSAKTSFPSRRTVSVAGLIVLAALLVLAGSRVFSHRSNSAAAVAQPQDQPSRTELTEPSAAVQAPPPPSVAPAVTQSVEGASGNRSAEINPTLPTLDRPEAPSTASASNVVPGEIVQRILPDASQKARDTIRGTVRISIKLFVDESGRVTNATFEAPGPSQYFADRAMQAAQLWQFSAAKMDGRSVPSEWVIHFEIDPAAINSSATETAP
jgi:eukaryotic-like serine/threonine-protein kinase